MGPAFPRWELESMNAVPQSDEMTASTPMNWATSSALVLVALAAATVRPLRSNQVKARPSRARPISMMAKSRALPWQECPAHLEGMIGNAGFDPLGLSTPQNIKWMREAELEHGRLCMLAWTGYVLVDLGVKFPGEKYAKLTSFTAHDATVSNELFYALLLVGTCETIKFSPIYSMMLGDTDRQPGDFGFDPLKLLTPENEVKYKTAELTHGRAAMLAFSAVVTQSALGHSTFPYI